MRQRGHCDRPLIAETPLRCSRNFEQARGPLVPFGPGCCSALLCLLTYLHPPSWQFRNRVPEPDNIHFISISHRRIYVQLQYIWLFLQSTLNPWSLLYHLHHLYYYFLHFAATRIRQIGRSDCACSPPGGARSGRHRRMCFCWHKSGQNMYELQCNEY